jgi:hypothetical protein
MEILGVSPAIVSEIKAEIYSYDMFTNCNNGPLRSAAKRSNFYHKYFAYCNSVEVFIGFDRLQKKKNIPICPYYSVYSMSLSTLCISF